MVLVLPKENPVFGVVVAWPKDLLKRLVPGAACCWPNRLPVLVPNPPVPEALKVKIKACVKHYNSVSGVTCDKSVK